MSLSFSVSPASSPSFSLSPPQQPMASPFPPDLHPPSLPPVTSPPDDHPLLPPEAESSVSPPPLPPPLPLVPELPPPSPALVPAIVASPPPSLPPPLPASPPPLPVFASPPVPTESQPAQPSPVIATPPPEAPEITISPPSVITPPAPSTPSSTAPSVPSTPSIITPPPAPSPPSTITPSVPSTPSIIVAPAPSILTPPAPSQPSTITPSLPSTQSIITTPAPSILTPPAPLTPATTATTPSPDSMALPTPTASSSSGNGGLPAAVQIRNPGQKARVSPGFVAGIAVVSLVVVLVVVVACVVYGKRQRRRSRKRSSGLPHYYPKKAPSLGPKDNLSTMATLHSPTKTTLGMSTTSTSSDSGQAPPSQGVFSYDQLAEATGYFSEANLLGEGGFGRVYRGVLAGGGKEVAVKQLGIGSRQGEREFRAEVDIITRIHHKHLVSLVGYCITGAERLLVYEFMPNNTLEFHLHGNPDNVMDWATRLRIAVGAAKGLAYLHEDCNPKIIHRDIKASNILLDFRFEAKVSDFGLAKSLSDTSTHTSHISTRVVGTFGYLAPEYASSGKVTEKSDVYSYGVMLLELITGKPPICSIDPLTNQGLVEWARPLLVQAMDSHDLDSLVDPRLGRNYDAVQMSRTVSCAAACVRHSAWLRPRMSQIVHALEGHATLTDLHEGITPGNSTQYSCPSSSYDANEYRSDLNRFHRTIADQEYSGSTSEYGLNPSVSSGEASQRFRV